MPAPRTTVAEAAPQGHWKILTILGALSLRGLLGTMTIEAISDGDIFLAYVEHVLCPALRPGTVARVVLNQRKLRHTTHHQHLPETVTLSALAKGRLLLVLILPDGTNL